MKRRLLLLCWVALSFGLWGCGGSGGGDEPAVPSTATISGRLVEDNVVQSALHSYTVEAVDETATTRAVATDVNDGFTFEVPVGHDYVLVLSDEAGVIGGMTYDAGSEQHTAFHVEDAGQTIAVGQIRVDVAARRAHRDASEAAPLSESSPMYTDDHDGDHVPDAFDRDDDNDSIHDQDDHDADGQDLSMDHDNDGINDQDDHGIDGEDMSNDENNDGEDDDHSMTDSDSGVAGDAANGQRIFENNCVGCHDLSGNQGEDSIAGTSLEDMQEVLRDGVDSMPAYPQLLEFATDLVAYLSGNPVVDTGTTGGATGGGTTGGTTGDTGGTTGGGIMPPARPAALDTTCLGCHGDRSARVSCASTGWLGHNAARGISAGLYQEISIWATGGQCQ